MSKEVLQKKKSAKFPLLGEVKGGEALDIINSYKPEEPRGWWCHYKRWRTDGEEK